MHMPTDWDHKVGAAGDIREVFEAMPVIAAAFRGPEHRFIAMNAYCRALFPKLTALGQPVREAFPEVLGQFIFEMFDRVFETGERYEAREWRAELDLDGSGHVHEMFVDAMVTARRDKDGAIDGIQALFQDVTERVRTRMEAEARAADMSERYQQVRMSATVMQQALLAPSVPVLPGVDVAAEYLVAVEDTAAGGDWFDAIACDDGSLVMIVGDVVGNGVEAAAVMSQLRTAARLQVLSGKTVTETMDVVEKFSRHVRGARSASMCVGRLDTQSGAFEYCTAGHPPPLLIIDGQPRYAEPSGGGTLGSGRPHVAKTDTLQVGDVVLLYTDGLVERPHRQLATTIAEFADVAASILAGGGYQENGAKRPVDRLCSQALEVLLRDGGYNDDVTLLAVQRTPVVPPLRIAVETDRYTTPTVRARLRDWLADLGADDADVIVIEHAVSEYVENSVQHAYRGTAGGSVIIEASLDRDATLRICVVDQGQWKPPDANRPGRGLTIASGLIEGTRVVRGENGTQSEIVYPLSRPARLVTDPMIGHGVDSAARVTYFEMHTEPDGLMIVLGDVDALHAPLLAGRITGESQSATVPLDIDLSAITHLSSAAVRVLADAHALADAQGARITFIAPPGSTAHHILTMVGLPTSR